MMLSVRALGVFLVLLCTARAQQNVQIIYEALLDLYLPVDSEDPQCRAHAALIKTEALDGKTEWAQTMMDSSAMPPNSGMKHGSLWDFGNFDNCLLLETTDAWDSNLQFVPQYCLVDVDILFEDEDKFMYKLYKNHTSHWAFCIPSSCNGKTDLVPQVQKSMNMLVGSEATAVVSVKDVNCRILNDPRDDIDGWVIFTIVGLCLIGGLVIVGTLVEFLDLRAGKKRSDASKGKMAILAFSAITNGKSIFSLERVRGSIDCINGLRWLSIMWVMMGHRWSREIDMPAINHDRVVRTLVEDWSQQAIMNGYLSVDTFFVLGGFLLCYIFMRGMDATKKFDVFTFYLYRYLRLTPPMGLVIWLYARIMPYVGWGPLWYEQTLDKSYNCQQHWWVNLLYVNNYVYPEGATACLRQGWYLAVDMQFFILSPILMYPLWRWPKIGYGIAVALLVNGLFWPYYITVVNEFPWQSNWEQTSQQKSDYFINMYNPAWTRFTPYVVGIMLGYLMHKCRGQKITMKPLVVACGWLACAGAGLSIIFTLSIQYLDDHPYNAWEAGAYNSFHHLGWALCISWIIFACHHGYGGPVNSILSWVYFQPLARLSYCAYLVHIMVQLKDQTTLRSPQHYSLYRTIHKLPGDFLFILIISLAVNLASETPILILEKTFLKKAPKPKKDVVLETVSHDDKKKQVVAS